MRTLKSRAFWGSLLIVAGGLLLLQSLGSLPGAALLWTVLFSVSGAAFLYVFFRYPENWWAAIPGFALLGLSAVTAWDELGLGPDDRGGALFLGGIGLGFVAVYLAEHEHWWDIIPGGVLLTLALVSVLPASLAGTTTAGALFFGLALTFGYLVTLPVSGGRMMWPIIPAAVLALVGALITAGAPTVLNFVWPVALILGGGYLLLHAIGTGGGSGKHA